MTHEMMKDTPILGDTHQDMPMMDKLDQAIKLLQSYIDDPSLATPKTLQDLQDVLSEVKDGMASDMSAETGDQQPMPISPSANHMTGAQAEAVNPYGGTNRRYTYAQYRAK